MNKICVYAIAKNEENNVEQWVVNMQPADHIIVLDTGSTDNTVELLRSLGVEVHENNYTHFRFDTARNDCLDLIPEEYNIRVSIDLDERFEQNNWATIIKQNWREDAPRVIYNYVWNHNSDGSNGLEFIINKIHGIDPNLRWKGAVHEHLYNTVTQSKKFEKYIDLTQVLTVHHYQDSSKDRLSYMELADERIQEESEDCQSWILYANEQKTKGDPQKAINAYQHVLNNFVKDGDAAELAACYYGIGQCYNKLDDGFNAMSAYAAGIALNKYYRDNYYGLGCLLIANNMIDMAIGVLEEGLSTSERAYGWMEDPFTWTYSLYDALGVAYSYKGDYKKALGYAAKALSFDSNNSILIEHYNDYLSKL